MSDEIHSTTERTRFRYVLDLDGGERWMVEERAFHGHRSLFFSHDGGFIRQRHFPENWFELSDAEILALLPAPVSGEAETSRQSSASTRGRLAVLIIDDSATDRYVAKRMFERASGQVFEASDPQAGIEMARMLRPDVILLDYKLPGTNGAAVIQALKADPTLAAVPVLLYTSYVDGVAADARALARGVIDKGSFTPASVEPLLASIQQ